MTTTNWDDLLDNELIQDAADALTDWTDDECERTDNIVGYVAGQLGIDGEEDEEAYQAVEAAMWATDAIIHLSNIHRYHPDLYAAVLRRLENPAS